MTAPVAVAAKESPAAQGGGRAPGQVIRPPRPVFTPPVVLQRKCACGGSCSGCAEEKANAPPLQAKLQISSPGDAFEAEADRMAERVVSQGSMKSGSAAVPSVGEAPSKVLQRKCACGGGCSGCKQEDETVQRKAASNEAAGASTTEVHPQALGSGAPLDAPTRSFMESRFDADFSDVRIHTGVRASSAARSVNALAYTVGRDVVFGDGQYSPTTTVGQRLLAHELTHVLQQRSGATASLQRQVAPESDTADDVDATCGGSGGGLEKCPRAPTHRGDAPLPVECATATYAGSAEVARFHFCEDSDCLAAPDRLDFLDSVLDTQPDNARYILHGYASPEGRADYNSRLSCHRVIRVVRSMQERLRVRLEQDKKVPQDAIGTALKDRIEFGSRGPSSDFAGGAAANRVVVVYAQSPGRDADPEPACKDAPRHLGDIQPDPGCDPPTLKLEEMEGSQQLSHFHFCLDSDVLSTAPASSVAAFAHRQAAGASFVVHGFASKEGNADANQRLSCHRALRLSRELMNAGARPEQIREVAGRGATDHFSAKDPEFNRVGVVFAEGGAVSPIREMSKAPNAAGAAAIVTAAQSRIFSGQYALAADSYISFWTCGRTPTLKAAVERLNVLIPSRPLVDKFEQRDKANGTEESGDFNEVLEVNTSRLSNTALRADNPVECTMGRIIDMAFHHAINNDSALDAPFRSDRDLRHRVGLHLISLAGLNECTGRFARKDDTKKTGIDEPLPADPLAGKDPLPCAVPPQATRLLPPSQGDKQRGSPTFIPFNVPDAKDPTKVRPFVTLRSGTLFEPKVPADTPDDLGGVRTLRTRGDVLRANASVSVTGVDPRHFGDYEVGFIQTIVDDLTLAEYVSGHLVEQKLPTPIRAAQMRGDPPVSAPWTADGAKRLDEQGQATVEAKWSFDTSFALQLNTLPGERETSDLLDTLQRHTTVAVWLIARRLGSPADRFSTHFIEGSIYEITQDLDVDFRRQRGDLHKDPTNPVEVAESERDFPVFTTAFRASETSAQAADPRLARFDRPVAAEIDFNRQVVRVVEPSAPGPDALSRPQFEAEAREILDHLIVFGTEEELRAGRGGFEMPRLGFTHSKLAIKLSVNPLTGRLRPTTGFRTGKPTIVIDTTGIAREILDSLALALGLRLQKRDFRKQGRSVVLKDPPADGIVAFTIPPKDTRKLGDFDSVIDDMAEMFNCTRFTEEIDVGLNSREFGAVYFIDRDQVIHRRPESGFVMSPRQTDDGWQTNLPCGLLKNSFTFGTVHTHPESDGGDHQKKPSGPDIRLARGGNCGIDHYVVSRFGVFEYHHPDPKPVEAPTITEKVRSKLGTKPCRQVKRPEDVK